MIRVCRGWDDNEGAQATKTEAGARAVPLAGVLRRILAAHKLASKQRGEDLVFGRTEALPFIPAPPCALGLGRRGRLRAWSRSPRTRHGTARPAT